MKTSALPCAKLKIKKDGRVSNNFVETKETYSLERMLHGYLICLSSFFSFSAKAVTD